MRKPKDLLKKARTKGNQNLDQYFLMDEGVLNRLQSYAREFDCDHILEIGAGIGNLTDKLVEISGGVTAIEIDPLLVDFLSLEFKEEISTKKLHLIQGDILEVQLPPYTVSVSNLPYELSSKILFRLLPSKMPLVLMVQKEFAQRLVAKPNTPEYGRLTITAGHYADIEIIETVSPLAFNVRPAVESAIVKLVPSKPDYIVENEAAFLQLVTAVFTQRRKKMVNSIKNTTHISHIENPTILIELADEELMNSRPGELTPADFAILANILANSTDD
ncbi:16S rRNA (adenine(1518)-N(6)/adenine(1519)-N(6))-dimethyltransferase RsmA [Candidatus Hikarchaeum yamanae]|uniref:16S rRNA (adenine(1518)-N(6)/adenine(1519)-N(6))- dimethyltransferase RsmA n=1 Tax=Candidatus Hikarchaeum yamanae TaxID=2675326 RepID=UPI0039E83BCC|tara:strand:- start:9719 stop:10543 length:825 start_codon:yes stop_codon:yes gene_type:complete